mmetsp:Transcript_67407/g.189983  ORF Transcript_67407/g.189983 Transcript_67407/m.189983 type:complete len:325 (+) Transcript_67407:40-1014(+)
MGGSVRHPWGSARPYFGSGSSFARWERSRRTNSVVFQCGLIKHTLRRELSASQVARNQEVEHENGGGAAGRPTPRPRAGRRRRPSSAAVRLGRMPWSVGDVDQQHLPILRLAYCLIELLLYHLDELLELHTERGARVDAHAFAADVQLLRDGAPTGPVLQGGLVGSLAIATVAGRFGRVARGLIGRDQQARLTLDTHKDLVDDRRLCRHGATLQPERGREPLELEVELPETPLASLLPRVPGGRRIRRKVVFRGRGAGVLMWEGLLEAIICKHQVLVINAGREGAGAEGVDIPWHGNLDLSIMEPNPFRFARLLQRDAQLVGRR